ncbi:arylsulfotransferase family protein [Defluviimonas sp. SAOS-178_SWC]|uniref:arylsulfotransferase family protein n=1 Tax=Defluviimonas sp. SAOS-178_SWC TaxID=3121287 RepID=UPI003221BABE
MIADLWRRSVADSDNLAEKLPKIGLFLGLLALAFAWGVATVKWKVFPHHQLVYLESGVVALSKMEVTELPHAVIELAPDETSPDPVALFGPEPAGDVILMTGGFNYRQDICPEFGCMAWVMERDGTVLHSWQYDPSALFDRDKLAGFTGEREAGNIYVQGAALDPAGHLVVTFQARNMFPYQVAVARFDWDGRLDWIRIDGSHHWPTVGDDGRVYVPMARIESDATTVAATRQKLQCKYGAVFQEGVRVISPDGAVLHEFWMDDVVRMSDAQGLAYSVRDDCDPYHVNGIALLNEAAAHRLPGARAGDLLVSLRSSSSLVVLDRDSGRIKHHIAGPMVAQHSPRVLPDGDVAVFDNLGGIDTARGTRVLKLDIVTGAPTTLFPRDADKPGGDLFSEAQGDVNFSADGSRALVAETLGGRMFEFDTATGAPIWSYRSVSDMAPFYAAEGNPVDGPAYALMHTQGAHFLSRAAFRRLTGG